MRRYIKDKLSSFNIEIKDDYYTYDEKQYALVGSVTHSILQLGDEVYIKVKNADLIKKQLDFYFIRKSN